MLTAKQNPQRVLADLTKLTPLQDVPEYQTLIQSHSFPTLRVGLGL